MHQHWVIRNKYHRPFQNRDICQWAWNALQELFAKAKAAILMPNHIHVLSPDSALDVQKTRLTYFQREISDRADFGKNTWDLIPNPTVVWDEPSKLMPMIRYIHLNPCRAGIQLNPLQWEWSTHRDYLSMTIHPWVRSDHDPQKFHKYISTDSTVPAQFTQLQPLQIPAKNYPLFSLEEIQSASIIANRAKSESVQKRGFVRKYVIHLAARLGWSKSALLAQALNIDHSTVWRILERRPIDVSAGIKILSQNLADTTVLHGEPPAAPGLATSERKEFLHSGV